MSMTESNADLPFGLTFRELLGAGSTGLIIRLDAVIKWAHSEGNLSLEHERRVYERLQRDHPDHPRFLRYYGAIQNGLILGYARHASIRQYFADWRTLGHTMPGLSLRLRWIKQTLEMVQLLHSSAILHGDLSCTNLFLDENLDIKGGDFAGSAIDGEATSYCVETRYSHPELDDVSRESEIFALGSCLYEIITGVEPYKDLPNHEVAAAYTRGQFPDVSHLDACSHIIAKCWAMGYGDVAEIVDDVRTEVQAISNHTAPGIIHQIQKPSKLLRTLPIFLPLLALPVVLWLRRSR